MRSVWFNVKSMFCNSLMFSVNVFVIVEDFANDCKIL